MRFRFIVFASLSLLILSCTKDKNIKTSTYADIPSAMIGSWNWLSSSGGFAGVTYTPESTGEVRKIVFSSDNKIGYYVNGSLTAEHPFHLEKSISIFTNDSTLMLIVEPGTIMQSISFPNIDTLELNDELFDGFEHEYKRLK